MNHIRSSTTGIVIATKALIVIGVSAVDFLNSTVIALFVSYPISIAQDDELQAIVVDSGLGPTVGLAQARWVFLTQGGIGGKWAVQNMAKVSGRRPIARMIIYASQLNKPITEEKIAKFVSEIGMS